MRALRLASFLVLALTAGCSLYFGDDDDCPPYGGDSAGVPAIGQRNPDSGQCEYLGGIGPYPCDERCGPCVAQQDSSGTGAGQAEEGQALAVSWGYCESACTGLGESDCLAASGCRGIYWPTASDDGPAQFLECWSTDQAGPQPTDRCAGLDAYSCSLHDSCIAIHQADCGGTTGSMDAACYVGGFLACADEPAGCYSDATCPDGTHCNAIEVCLPPPGCEGGACDAACYGTCVPDGWVGECYGTITCDALPPTCAEGYTPGTLDGCWTYECIPVERCEVPPPACGTIADEMSCVSRVDCTPYYRGEDCACVGDACTCTWIFDSCQE